MVALREAVYGTIVNIIDIYCFIGITFMCVSRVCWKVYLELAF